MREQEPAGYCSLEHLVYLSRVVPSTGMIPIYTRPPIERTLTDEVIADLWHQNGGFHHHFARAVERYLKGEK